jgi:hypothetical protein
MANNDGGAKTPWGRLPRNLGKRRIQKCATMQESKFSLHFLSVFQDAIINNKPGDN